MSPDAQTLLEQVRRLRKLVSRGKAISHCELDEYKALLRSLDLAALEKALEAVVPQWVECQPFQPMEEGDSVVEWFGNRPTIYAFRDGKCWQYRIPRLSEEQMTDELKDAAVGSGGERDSASASQEAPAPGHCPQSAPLSPRQAVLEAAELAEFAVNPYHAAIRIRAYAATLPDESERDRALEEALACYSPDDTAMDWALKINALKSK